MNSDIVSEKKVNSRNLGLIFDKYKHGYFWKKLAWSIGRWIIFSGMIYVLIYPLLFILATSFKGYEDMLDPTTIWIAKKPTFGNYVFVYKNLKFFTSFKNSMILSLATSLLQIASCSMIGYGLARFKFKEKGLIFGLIILTLVVPAQTVIIPQYIFYQHFDLFGLLSIFKPGGFNLLDSYAPFVLPALFGLGLKSGLFIFIFRQFFRGMPKELEDSAYIDGCGTLQTYLRVMLPNAKPAVVTVFLFAFVWHWNDYFEPNMYLTSGEKYTLAQRLMSIKSIVAAAQEGGTVYQDPMKFMPPSYAGVFIVLVPMLLLYIFGQRFFIENVERSGITG